MEDYESESDSSFSQSELESELYSVLHYNSFSGDLPSGLLEKYSIRRENNEFYISIKKDSRNHAVAKPGFLEGRDDNLSRISDHSLGASGSRTSLTLEEDCVTSTPKNTERYRKSTEKESPKKRIGPVKNLPKPEEEIILLNDSSDDSDVVIEERVEDVTYISSSSSVECLNDTVNMDGLLLNTSNNRMSNIFPEDLGVEEKIKVKWRNVSSPSTWSEGMRKYYNKPSESLKSFDYKKIIQEIKERGGTGNWDILPEDRFPLFKEAKRCTLCRQTDHLMKNCPKRYSNCSICGNPGHSVHSCPFRMCLNCGKQSNLFISMCQQCESTRYKTCDECKQVGHVKSNCPDTWRRYHSTTKGELVTQPDTVNERLMCCNCGKAGHLYEHCKNLYWSTYPPNSFLIKNKTEILHNPGKRKHFEYREAFQGGSSETFRPKKRPRWSDPQLFNNNRYNNHVPNTPKGNKKKKRKKNKSPHFQNNKKFNRNNTF